MAKRSSSLLGSHCSFTNSYISSAAHVAEHAASHFVLFKF